MKKIILILTISFFNCFADTDYNRKVYEKILSGDTFRRLADFILETNCPWSIKSYRGNLQPDKVKQGDIIFIESSNCLDLFFKEYYDKINNKFIMITHNHCNSSPREFVKYLDNDKIIAWFTSNQSTHHSKLIPIPLGLSNLGYPQSCNHEKQVHEVLTSKLKTKKIFLYINFNYKTNPSIRKSIWDFCKILSETKSTKQIIFSERKPFKEYITDLYSATFTISPPGAGVDCHRVWESLYMGCIPIVITSALDSLYSQFPILIVNNWNEVTEELLERKLNEFKGKKFNTEKLFASYWENLILQYKHTNR